MDKDMVNILEEKKCIKIKRAPHITPEISTKRKKKNKAIIMRRRIRSRPFIKTIHFFFFFREKVTYIIPSIARV